MSLQRAAWIEGTAEEQTRLKKKAADLDRQIDRLLDGVEGGDGGGRVRERLPQRETERAGAGARLAEISAAERAQLEAVSEEVLVEAIDEILAALETEDLELQRETLQSVVVRVELTNENGRLLYRLPFDGRMPSRVWYPVGDSNARF